MSAAVVAAKQIRQLRLDGIRTGRWPAESLAMWRQIAEDVKSPHHPLAVEVLAEARAVERGER